MKEQVDETTNTLLMQIAEADEVFSDFYLEGKEEEMKNPSNILSAIRRILISWLHFPSFTRKLIWQRFYPHPSILR